MYRIIFLVAILWSHAVLQAQPSYANTITTELLGRGVCAVRQNDHEIFVSWRYLQTDASDIAFDVYRNGEKVNEKPITDVTWWVDKNAADSLSCYEVRPAEEASTAAMGSYTLPAQQGMGCIEIPLDLPKGGTTPDGRRYSYTAGDASIGDVDGDGEYEIILKWDPTNAHDNSHDGYTGNVLVDCYRLSGEKLWRIDLGPNIRAGAHYTQFMVYDLDGDNRAEVVMRTADGTIDGRGQVIGNAFADYRIVGDTAAMRRAPTTSRQRRRYPTPAMQGRILDEREFLTLFSGLTGEAMYTTDYLPARGNAADWGDTRGNRSDRFLACIAYLDGKHPSVVMCRGYYTRSVLAAFDWNGKELVSRWVFDSGLPEWRHYSGQGNHNLRVGDVDGDGCDEIVYGSCTIDHDGKGLYNTGLGHGDALHMTAFYPDSTTLQVWACHENRRDGSTLRDARTGRIIHQYPSHEDVGRCMASDIDPRHPGVEMWSLASGGIRNLAGEVVASRVRGLSCNMAIWWDGDLLRELLDGTRISKYQWEADSCQVLTQFELCAHNNSTKSNPCLQADIIGDWREEVLVRTRDNRALHLYTSTIPTPYRLHTFLHDPIYRISIATQNVAYNQPTHTGFYVGSDVHGEFRGTHIP
ncbi:MAG: rhamnogalacturonan lyase [Bacteroidales bacterium]|nr:rhamnogalacturonan lyase [Bacteroidales bacterium]